MDEWKGENYIHVSHFVCRDITTCIHHLACICMISLFQVEQIMEKFEKQFEDLDVRTQVHTKPREFKLRFF